MRHAWHGYCNDKALSLYKIYIRFIQHFCLDFILRIEYDLYEVRERYRDMKV